MDVIRSITNIPSFIVSIYYFFVLFGALVFFYRFGINKITGFFVLVFWSGFFDYLTSLGIVTGDFYKILLIIYAIFLFWKQAVIRTNKKDKSVILFFLLFSTSFWATYFIYPHAFMTVFSQYTLKYFLPVLVFLGFKELNHNSCRSDFFLRIFAFIVYSQVVFSILKILLFGGFLEAIVGSISYIGAGVAVTLPILGLFLIWLRCDGELTKKDWLLTLSLIFIALASSKRTPVFAFPIFAYLLTAYVKQGTKVTALIKYVPLLLILLYFGIRSNYTLNPEGSSWGSFDIEYAYRYVLQYNFGTYNLSELPEITSGRGGSFLLILNPHRLGLNSTGEILFGRGVAEVALATQGRFLGGIEYGIEHEGLLGAATTLLYQVGYIGFVLYIFFVYSMIRIIKDTKLRKVISFWFMIDFFLYYNSTLLDPSMAMLFIFILFYSNIARPNKSIIKLSNFKQSKRIIA